MNKKYWKQEAKEARQRAVASQEKAYSLRLEVDQLTRELEDKRKNWTPIKIKHPYTPIDPKCTYCDDPAEDPRHG